MVMIKGFWDMSWGERVGRREEPKLLCSRCYFRSVHFIVTSSSSSFHPLITSRFLCLLSWFSFVPLSLQKVVNRSQIIILSGCYFLLFLLPSFFCFHQQIHPHINTSLPLSGRKFWRMELFSYKIFKNPIPAFTSAVLQMESGLTWVKLFASQSSVRNHQNWRHEPRDRRVNWRLKIKWKEREREREWEVRIKWNVE